MAINFEDFISWMKDNPSLAAQDLTEMCNESFHFQFSRRCVNCNYFVNGNCCPELLAEEIEKYF